MDSEQGGGRGVAAKTQLRDWVVPDQAVGQAATLLVDPRLGRG